MANAAKPDRLDSWKAIAGYLNRDERTVRRWERDLALPVRRLAGGRGRSVYAFVPEIDAWLQADGAERDAAKPSPPAGPAAESSRRWLLWAGGVAGIVAVIGVGAGLARPWRPPVVDGLRVETAADGIRAMDRTGTLLWKSPFPAQYQTAVLANSAVVMTGANPAVYVFTHVRQRVSDSHQEVGSPGTELEFAL